MKLYITVGLPASGKSTWARALVRESTPGSIVRVNKDLLRLMLHDGVYAKGTEKQVLTARDSLVHKFLSAGCDVVVDDTNFHPAHIARLNELAGRHGAEVIIRHFDVDVDECIRRDAHRQDSVGEQVIREMAARYLNA
jgi:predicted kinase